MGTHDPFVKLDGGIEVFGGWMGMDVDAVVDGATLVEAFRSLASKTCSRSNALSDGAKTSSTSGS